MITETAVTAKPSTSRLINISLYRKLSAGGLAIVFFDGCRGERVRGLRSGLTSDLTFTGLRSRLASGLTFVGLTGVIGLFIRKSIDSYKHDRFYLLKSVLFNNKEKLRLVFR